MKNSHSPLPWSVEKIGDEVYISMMPDTDICKVFCPYPVPGESGEPEATEERRTANAALIVRAVNSHQALVDALKECRSYLDLKIAGFRQDYPEDHCMVQTPIRLQATVDAALALATK